MSLIIGLSLDLDTFAVLVKDGKGVTTAKNGKRYIAIAVSVDDEVNQYGRDCSVWIEQSKAQREAKEKRDFIGGGKVLWGKQQPTPTGYQAGYQTAQQEDDLPF